MKIVYTSFLLLLSITFRAQVFTATGGAVLNNGGQETIFNLNVSGLPQNLDSLYGIEEICIDVQHPAVEELTMWLKSPTGIQVDLVCPLSCSGANYSTTCFNNNAGSSVTVNTAPYNGSFRPVGNLGRFNTNMAGNGTWKLYIKDFVSGANAGTLNSWSVKFSATPAQPVNFVSSNLPLVFLNIPGNNQISTSDQLCDLAIVDNGANRNYLTDPRNGYNGKALCHIRGSSSQMFEKLNMKVELTDASGTVQQNASLLGMPAESDWCLTSGYSDKTLMRNALTQYLFQQMGHYSPRYRFVELFINGEYFGVYLLMEKVKRGTNRVDVQKMTIGDNTWPYVSGGYILQINRTDNPGWYSAYPGISSLNNKFYYQYDYPKATDITSQQMNYIQSYMDTFETVMASPNFADPLSGYPKYIDDNSFIDFFILNEFSKDVDAYRLSTYLFKDNLFDGGKLHAGPMWDYDLAWHNDQFGNTNSPMYWQYTQNNDDYPIPTWWSQFMQDPNFKNKLYCRYHTLRQGPLSNANINTFLDGLALLLNEAKNRNFKQFPILGAYIYPNPQNQSGANYTTEVNDLKQWVSDRGTWLDNNIPGYCNNVGTNSIVSLSDMDVYPNPFVNNVSVNLDSFKGQNVQLQLTDMLGQSVFSTEKMVDNESESVIKTDALKPGSYILKVQVQGVSAYKKIVKL